jgi:DNA (cytosine-5)-methyltransferase 1
MRINTSQYNMNFGTVMHPETKKLKAGIFFAGGGGISKGLEPFKKRLKIAWLLNHDAIAIKTSSFHNKGTTVYWSDVYMQDEKEMEPVHIVQASLECDAHTDANPTELKDKRSYAMGWEFFRYLPHLNPLVIHIENVPSFKKWGVLGEDNKVIKGTEGFEFERWKKAIMDLGYEYKESIRNAADDGLPTRRVRYFAFFYRPGIEINFPESTHNEHGTDGKLKWKACREHIDLEDTGTSIFGREYNMDLPKNLRRRLVPNSEKRIVGGIKKQNPELYQFLCKYHAGENFERSYSLNEPLRTVDGSNRHQLVTVNGGQFIQDHCQTDHYQNVDKPLKTQLTWQTKQLVTMEKLKFIMDHCHSDKIQSVDEPLGVQTTRQSKQLVDINETFIVQYYGGSIQSNSLDEPINTIPCRDIHQLVRIEKMQFLTMYFNSNGHPESNTDSLDRPLSPILQTNKHQLVTVLDDFDIKVRFLRADELAACSTFPRDYFSHPELKLSQKHAIQLIGNAVPPKWITLQMECNIDSILQYRDARKTA